MPCLSACHYSCAYDTKSYTITHTSYGVHARMPFIPFAAMQSYSQTTTCAIFHSSPPSRAHKQHFLPEVVFHVASRLHSAHTIARLRKQKQVLLPRTLVRMQQMILEPRQSRGLRRIAETWGYTHAHPLTATPGVRLRSPRIVRYLAGFLPNAHSFNIWLPLEAGTARACFTAAPLLCTPSLAPFLSREAHERRSTSLGIRLLSVSWSSCASLFGVSCRAGGGC